MKFFFLLIGLGISLLQLGAQIPGNTAFYSNKNEPTDSISASYSEFTEYFDTTRLGGRKTRIYLNSGAKQITEYSNLKMGLKNGIEKRFFPSGEVQAEVHYSNGALNGVCRTWYANGQLKRDDLYERGKLIKAKCFSSTGQDTTHFEYQISARYPGGEAALHRYLIQEVKYPAKARKKNIEGTVIMGFIINKEGNISNIEVVRGVDPLLDDEAYRVIQNMGKWITGSQDGEPASFEFKLPIKFKLQ